MSKPALPTIRFDIYKLLIAQCVVVLAIALFFQGYHGLSAATSSLLGGVVCILPNFFFAKQLLAKIHSTNPKIIVKTLFIGEVIKLLSIAILFVLVLKYIPINLVTLLAGFIGAQFAFWFAPLLFNPSLKGATR